MRKVPWAALALLAATLGTMNVFAGCGSDSADIVPPTDDAGDGSTTATDDATAPIADGGTDSGNPLPDDASLNDAAICKLVGQTCASSTECCTANCNATTSTCDPPLGECKAPGAACVAPNECCTGSCIDGKCSDKQCVPDKPTSGVCGLDGDCCSGICRDNACISVNPGQTCRTAGNPCSAHAECCSNLCNNGVCSSAVSFCTQRGEVCSTSFECCGGNCVKQPGNTTGVCGEAINPPGVPAGCAPSGTVCGGEAGGDTGDGGILPCDQTCCSRACGYFGARAGFRVCQPPSGCRPTGEICRVDSDCCGWSGAPEPVDGPVFCAKTSPTAEFGRCNNGGSCREPGSICKPGDGDSCSAENNCCEHPSIVKDNGQHDSSYCNDHPENCCNKDALGIPRCLIKPIDCTGAPPPAGTVCATSADCCGAPCIENKCGAPGSCVETGGACTVTADCCPGVPCVQPPGSTKGVCGGTLTPDGGVSDAGGGTADGGSGNLPDGGTCALYGQLCSSAADCCNGVPCTEGRCRYP